MKGFGSLAHWADEAHGSPHWRDDARPAAEDEFEAVDETSAELFESYSLDEAQIDDFTNTQIIEDMLDDDSIMMAFGASGKYKSFATLKIGFHVATGRPLNGRKVRQGLVVYIPLEGTRAFRRRVAALIKQEPLQPGEPRALEIIKNTFRLTAKADIEKLIATIRALEKKHGAPCRLIIIDTLAKASPGIDEDKAKEMGPVFRNLDSIRQALRCTCGVIHHEGKDSSRGPRGSSSMHAGIDTEIRVSDKILEITKQRDGEDGVKIHFDVDRVVLGHDQNGKPVTSLVVRWLGAADEFPVELTPEEQGLMDAFEAAARKIGGENWRKTAVTTAQWDAAYCELFATRCAKNACASQLSKRSRETMRNDAQEKKLVKKVSKGKWLAC